MSVALPETVTHAIGKWKEGGRERQPETCETSPRPKRKGVETRRGEEGFMVQSRGVWIVVAARWPSRALGSLIRAMRLFPGVDYESCRGPLSVGEGKRTTKEREGEPACCGKEEGCNEVLAGYVRLRGSGLRCAQLVCFFSCLCVVSHCFLTGHLFSLSGSDGPFSVAYLFIW